MAQPTRLLLATVCALALPSAALADPPSAASSAAGSCAAQCAQLNSAGLRAHPECREFAAQRAARARARAHATAIGGGPTRVHVDTTIARTVTQGCRYTATAQGSYRSADAAGVRTGAPLRDVDVRADAELSCNGQTVRRGTERWVFPQVSRDGLASAMHSRLTLKVPGSRCAWGSTYGFQGGSLVSEAVEGNCSSGESLSAVEGYGAPAVAVRANAPPAGEMVEGVMGRWNRGGGPRRGEPTADDARVGTR